MSPKEKERKDITIHEKSMATIICRFAKYKNRKEEAIFKITSSKI